MKELHVKMQYSRMHSMLALEAMMAGLTGTSTEKMDALYEAFGNPEDRMRIFAKDFNFEKRESAAELAVATSFLIRDALKFFGVEKEYQQAVGAFMFEIANAIFPGTIEGTEKDGVREMEGLVQVPTPKLVDVNYPPLKRQAFEE